MRSAVHCLLLLVWPLSVSAEGNHTARAERLETLVIGGLDLESRVPDHSTFSLNRHGRFRESDAFRLLLENELRRCMAAGLVGGEGFAVDASVLEADASRYHGEAPEILREPIEEIRLVPEGDDLQIELYGELVAILALTNENPRRSSAGCN